MATKKPLYPNPFYVVLVVASTAFVVTVLGYLVAPMVQQKSTNPAPGATVPGAGSIALAAWFDRWAVTLIAVEIVAMIVCGLLAMASDRWFAPKDDAA